ncbi:MAG: HIT family protein [Candidatus Nanohaloarchaea archaeon]|nr:HIT family protein [Candidatus Nanohaloarchaea archaeon]
MTEDCLFCKIIEGEIDSHKVFETDRAFAFLDVNPVSRGHTLVIPKKHAETLTDLRASETEKLFSAVRKVSEAVEEALQPEGFNILQSNGEEAGQEIGHAHVHIIPRYEDDGFEFKFDQRSIEEQNPEELIETLRKELSI